MSFHITMRYRVQQILSILTTFTICVAKTRLSLWIDGNQVANFIGYPVDIFIISDGAVAPYIRDPNFDKNIPVIPPEVDTVNLTWEAGDDTFTYWFDDLKSLDEKLLYNPLLSIPASGVIPGGPKIFQMSIPCTGEEAGIAALILGLQIFNKNGRPIRGSPMKLKLKKQCVAFVPSTLCQFECLNGGRCNQLGHCECGQGFHGARCERSMCDPGCQNNGTCMSPEVCICPDGFSGKRCERALCKEPCQHGGRCIQEDVCWCTSGFLGNACQFSKCKPNCEHGGVCIGDNRCRCPVAYSGVTCEKRVKREERPRRSNLQKKRGGKAKKRKKRKKKRKNLKRRRNRKLNKKNRKKMSKKKRKKSLLAEVTRFSRRKRKREQRRKERKRKRKERNTKRRKPFVR